MERLNRYLRLNHRTLLKSDSTYKEIKKVYRFLMKKYHPDNYTNASRNAQLDAEEISKEINAAFDVLMKIRNGSVNDFQSPYGNSFDIASSDTYLEMGFFPSVTDYKKKKKNKAFYKQ